MVPVSAEVECGLEGHEDLLEQVLDRELAENVRELLGVLDLDSPDPGRFDSEDAEGLGTLVRLLLEGSDFRRLVDTGHLGDRRPG